MDKLKYLDKDGLLYVWQKTKMKLADKVDKKEGYGLSKNDLTDELLEKINNAGDSSFSGNYNDLTNIPTLDGTQLKGPLTKEQLDIASAYKLLQVEGDIVDAMADIEEMKQAGYQTEDNVNNKIAEATKDFLTSKQISQKILSATEDMATNTSVDSKISDAIAGVTQFNYEIVDVLPESGKKGTIYLVKVETETERDIYEEYLWIDGKWERFGPSLDLTGFIKYTDLESITNEEIDIIFSE